jgi:DNA-binding CsgD family transcriptional regulator
MNKYNWSIVDWNQSNGAIANELGANKKHVRETRKKLEIKPFAKFQHLINWENVDWSKNNREISSILCCNRKTVSHKRKKLHQIPSPGEIHCNPVNWENVDWTNKTILQIAKESNRSVNTVIKYKNKLYKKTKYNFTDIDWSLSDTTIAKSISCHPYLVSYNRRKLKAPLSPIQQLKQEINTVDWNQSNGEIARCLQCDPDLVSRARKRLNKPQSLAFLNGNSHNYNNSYILLNGEKYDSLIECYCAMQFHANKINFVHHIKYPNSRKICDFYLLEKNEYVEVTSFNLKDKKIWPEYIKNIEFKRQYVEEVLKAKFTFIQKKLTDKEKTYVRKNLQKETKLKYPLFELTN